MSSCGEVSFKLCICSWMHHWWGMLLLEDTLRQAVTCLNEFCDDFQACLLTTAIPSSSHPCIYTLNFAWRQVRHCLTPKNAWMDAIWNRCGCGAQSISLGQGSSVCVVIPQLNCFLLKQRVNMLEKFPARLLLNYYFYFISSFHHCY